jgi:hypothetical protein
MGYLLKHIKTKWKDGELYHVLALQKASTIYNTNI